MKSIKSSTFRKQFVLAGLLISGLPLGKAHAAQMLGAQLESLQRTGYGMYVVRMKPSSHPGTISSFFLFHSDRLWPKGWAELDIEFTPGYRTKGDTARRFVLDHDNGRNPSLCYDATGEYGSDFFAKNCDVQDTAGGNVDISRYPNPDGAMVNRSLSFNTFGNSPLVLNQSATPGKPPIVQQPGDAQVFYNPPVDPYADFYNYYIWYTPTGVYWSGAVPESDINFPDPEQIPESGDFPTPVFAKVWNSQLQGSRFSTPSDIQFKNGAQKDALAYAADQFTLVDAANGEVLESGRQVAMTLNIWDGSKTVASLSPQPWGGYQPPGKATAAVYQKIAYFPLKDLKDEARQKRYPGPMDYTYERTTNYSDFTSAEGRFILNGRKASFDQLWMASDGEFAPLGVLSGYSVFCYPKAPLRDSVGRAPDMDADKGIYLQMRQAGDFAIPSIGQQAAQTSNYTNCIWADTRGTR